MADPAGHLPDWASVLVVVAHPDDESFGLGAVICAFIDAGARVSVLCLTQGEASTLHGVEGDLAAIRAGELASAGAALGVASVDLRQHPDGALPQVPLDVLGAEVLAAAQVVQADGILAFDSSGVTGHADHAHATVAAVAAADLLGLGVLGWTLPLDVAEALHREYGADFVGHSPAELAVVLDVDRARQLEAVACHPSQAVPGSVLWRRLELLGDREHLRWQNRPV